MNRGIKKQKVFVYREDGSRYAEFESEVEFAKHFKVAKNFLAVERKNYFGEQIVKIFDSGLYACNERIGSQRIKLYHKKMESKLLKKQPKKDREIGVFNLERELIATFKGYFYLESLLGKHVSVCKKEPKKITGDVYYMYL